MMVCRMTKQEPTKPIENVTVNARDEVYVYTDTSMYILIQVPLENLRFSCSQWWL
jgi:hypothetical protein